MVLQQRLIFYLPLMDEDNLNKPPDQPPVLSAEAYKRSGDANRDTKRSRFGIWSLSISILCPALILFSFFTLVEHPGTSVIIGYVSVFSIIIYPIISIILSSIALYREEKKTPAVLGIIFSIIGALGLVLYFIIQGLKGLNSVW
tara:strand:+ start:109 stop:540 length:432 start_codon:yes stop_codon:yes gene_type:complete